MDNFNALYDYLHAVNGRLSCLYLKIQSKRTLRSGYYWYMVILSNLISLESLIIVSYDGVLSSAYKSIVKGISNFKDKGGKLKKLFLHKVSTVELEGGIYKILKNLPDLESIETNDSIIDDNSGKSFGKILSDNKNVRELNFSGATYSNKVAKEIADGLMRAKMLEALKLKDARNIKEGMTSILYNLAFSPRIKYIDLTNFVIGSNKSL